MDDLNPVPLRVSNESEYLRFLVRAGEMLASSLDYRETLLNVCAAATETVADLCFLVMASDDGKLEILASAARDSSRPPDAAAAEHFLRAEDGRPSSIAEKVIRDGTSVLIREVGREFMDQDATSTERAQFMRATHFASIIVVPIPAPVRGVLGALTLVRTVDSGELFDGDSLLFAQDLARRCGGAIQRSRSYSNSQEIAASFQRAALPRSLPSPAGVTIDAYYEPADATMLIGGDWYDAFTLPDGRLGLTMGDVAGHGLEAAVFMGSIRDALRTMLYAGLPLAEALRVVDYHVHNEMPDGGYACANLATLDPETGAFQLISAGLPGPLIHSRHGEITDPFQERGLPLGLRELDPSAQPVEEIRLPRESFVAFFTDGLLEWQRDEVKGYMQVHEAIRDPNVRGAISPAYELRRTVVRGSHADDIAIMCLSYDR